MLSSTAISFGLSLISLVSATVIDVQVGGDGGALVYNPEAVSAQPGDQVVFHFNPKNHTVTQSSFANPCGLKDGGFNSGFMPIEANSTDAQPTYTVTVNDTQPIWVYCAQGKDTAGSHCGQGMVFAINCPNDDSPNSFSNFKQSALNIGASLSASAAQASSTEASSGDQATDTWTAPYGDYTVPPAPEASTVTATISLDTEVWTTTYASYPGSPQATPASAEGQVHKIVVGGQSGLVFDPPHVDAQPRDIIMFEFHQKNHTVTQSSFADPCRKLDANGTQGFDSGFMPVDDNASSFPTWNITVNDTSPIWAYCKQKTPSSHCGAGMVFAVNSVENSQRNFSAFQSVAKALNGSGSDSSTSSGSAPSTTPSDGAISHPAGGVALSIVMVAMVALMI